MTTALPALANSKPELFFERHAWKVLLGVTLIIGLFGLSDMVNGAADLQNGETILMHSLTTMSWNELPAASPAAAHLIDEKFRSDGAALIALALLTSTICLTGFRRGERWAWYALWAIPVRLALTVFFVWTAVRYPRYGLPVPVISGSIFLVMWVALLALTAGKFLRPAPGVDPKAG